MSADLEKRPSREVVSASTEEHHNTTARLGSMDDVDALATLGYKPELQRNRSMATLLFQSLAIAAIPYGEGGPLISAIYGGGQLSIFVGWIVILILNECIAVSLGELASRYPTSAGPYYWSFQIATNGKAALSYLTGWTWLIGNWTITLSVNFGLASLIAGTVAMYDPDWTATDWELLLIFYAICVVTLIICAVGNRFLPMVDTICAAWTALSIIVICIALSVKAEAGRHSARYALGHYDTSLSGWGGFTFFIGLLPAAYTFSAIGMISSMAEECADPTTKVPWAISLCVPVGGLAGFFFILPICFTMPPLEDIILAPYGQALPYIFQVVMGSPGGGLGLTFLVLAITVFCSISITVAASRCTWAFARDDAIPGAKIFSRVNHTLGVPLWALVLTTIVQMLLGLIYLGSSSAFLAFVSVGVQALAVSYAIPIIVSLMHLRREVNSARWTLGPLFGTITNVIAVLWIAFEVVLFSMPTVLPVTEVTMNYASVVLVGFLALAGVWYIVHARKCKLTSDPLSTRADLVLSLQRPARIRRTGQTVIAILRSSCSTCENGFTDLMMEECTVDNRRFPIKPGQPFSSHLGLRGPED
jgi:amino acid transporter